MTAYLQTDELLIEKLSKDDRKAFEAVYNQYFLQVFHFSLKFVEDRQIAEDITLETFLKLWDKRSELPASSNLSAFLCTIARNACLNHLRDAERLHNRHQELARRQDNDHYTFETYADPRSEVYRHLYQEIEKLPGRMADILQLSLKGLKNAEIAEHTGISEKTVRNLKTAAIRQLRTRLLKNELLLLMLLISR